MKVGTVFDHITILLGIVTLFLDEGRILVDEYIQVLKERFKGDGLPTLENIYASLRRSKDVDA